ncbi:MAG: hypothetical protein KDA30_08490 [Phycisphaerales bacterium]|nr:hypothetical protein [Phycisphaerales bacterium]
MKQWMKFATVGAITGAAALSTPGTTNTANAAKFVVIPIGYPIAECGTVGLADSWLNDDGSGEGTCLAWYSDSTGWAYLVSGLDLFQVGDRVFVEGIVCDNCLTTCFASAILDSTITPCDPFEPAMDAATRPAKR